MSRLRIPLLATLAALLVLVPAASARDAYVANTLGGSVSVVDGTANAVVVTIPVGAGPSDVAISPDGSRAYVTNEIDGTVSAIDVASRSALGSPIAVGTGPRGIAISPGGSRAYVANNGSDSLSVIDLGSASVVTTVPLGAGAEPEGVAVSPDGATVFVAKRDDDIAIVSAASNAVIGAIETSAGLGPSRLSLVPDGTRGFLTNANSSTVSVFSTVSDAVLGSPLLVGTNPAGIAVNPNGPRTYAAAQSANNVAAIDTASHHVVGSPVPGFESPAGIAVFPDGSRAYVADEGGSTVTVLETTTNAGGGKIAVGSAPRGVAIVPNQGPSAAFSLPPLRVKAEQAIGFDASASVDRDGRIAAYEWRFGDGEAETAQGPLTEHVYAKPGFYTATLQVTDSEGCSAALVFTGQTVSCNGSPAALATARVEVVDATPPEFRLFAKPRQPLRRFVIATGRCPLESCAATARTGRGPIARRTLEDGVPTRFKVRLPPVAYRAARRALARGAKARVKVTAVARDGAGNERRRKAVVRLIAPRRPKGKR